MVSFLAGLMDVLRGEIFDCSCFPEDQNVGIGISDISDNLKQSFNRRRFSDNCIFRFDLLVDFRLESPHFHNKAAFFDSTFNCIYESFCGFIIDHQDLGF
jgi:hypothetical protein